MSIAPQNYWKQVEMRTANWPLYELQKAETPVDTVESSDEPSFGDYIDIDAPLNEATAHATSFAPVEQTAVTPENTPADDDEDFGFFDMVDVINPLQHIPVVNKAYRAVTGDNIKPSSEIMGGGIYGGAIGALFGVAKTVVSSAFSPSEGEPTPSVQTAFSDTSKPQSAPIEDHRILAQMESYAPLPLVNTQQPSIEETERSVVQNAFISDDAAVINQKMLDAYAQYQQMKAAEFKGFSDLNEKDNI